MAGLVAGASCGLGLGGFGVFRALGYRGQGNRGFSRAEKL